MKTIVEGLRDLAEFMKDDGTGYVAMGADEIEKLRAERDEARRLAEQYRDDAYDIDANPDVVSVSRLPWEQ